ncbi:uncharacterized protein LODBEIA_P58110 [Lodderomyces beijingensis]|uniref:non-specific serine/threonine protein kinase n=1 Tax=Lodderomyces beijingensis TaxID=1775926 RepID=A0ABP0ZVK0_9ASCO
MPEDSISSDLERRQTDEFDSIASIYSDIFQDKTPTGLVWGKKPNPHFQVSLSSRNVEENPEVSITLDIEFTPTYPLSSPKVKLVEPHNLLKVHVKQLNEKLSELIKEYLREEVCFTVISELMYLLDDIQSKTVKVLSLEEEREERLKSERQALEEKEQQRAREGEEAMFRRNRELNEQIRMIRADFAETPAAREEDGGGGVGGDGSVDDVPLPSDTSDYFLFENELEDSFSQTGTRFKFRAISGFINYSKGGLLGDIGQQYIVKPYVSEETRCKLEQLGSELSYLLTEINLTHSYWQSDCGKREIQELENHLQECSKLQDSHILKLIGFQIDKVDGWKIRLLNEFSFVAKSLRESLPKKGHVDWALARSWLIQILPVLEYLHNIGVIHKSLNTETIYFFEEDRESGDERVVKLCHPSYGYKLRQMLEKHPNPNPKKKLVKSEKTAHQQSELWTAAPELRSGGIYTKKTDIWDLGIVFAKSLLGRNVLGTLELTTQELSKSIVQCDILKKEKSSKYTDLVGDLLSKMLQDKPAKRPSPIEINALKFLREGPALAKRDVDVDINADDSGLLSETNNYLLDSSSSSPPPPHHHSAAILPSSKESQGNIWVVSAGNSGSRVRSRYEREFEEIGRLGKGGFGDVVKARNKMEGTFYAIKKIKHRAGKLDSILNEVLSLARLNHQYIVRYYGTWVEELDEDSSCDDSVISSVTETQEEQEKQEGTRGMSLQRKVTESRPSAYLTRNSSFQVDFMSRSFNPGIDLDDIDAADFDDDDDDDDDADDDAEDAFEFANSSGKEDARDSNDEWSVSDEKKKKDTEKDKDKRRRSSMKAENKQAVVNSKMSMLYIQMEFCENNTLFNLIQQGLPNNPKEYWMLFRQLLDAVSYIHKEGFIHRDLKPVNIFIDRSNTIKVGDFGLAKNSQNLLPTSSSGQGQLDSSLIAKTRGEDLSTIVGTVLYTAPEVASGNYDEKVDMFSLGVIFFEMCYHLSTGMERIQTLTKLREQEFPSNWKNSLEKKIVKQLLSADPESRLGAAELLQSGWLPVEQQDQVVREALKSLADPASPWQQQVRETLFKQPYSQARDVLYDSNPGGPQLSSDDVLLQNKLLGDLVKIFKRHGAVENLNLNLILPKAPSLMSNPVCEVLDSSGFVVTLPFDLTIPVARSISRNSLTVRKFYRHEFVYRPNLRSAGAPDKYSAMNFNIVSDDRDDIVSNDAECLKIVDEILGMVANVPSKKKKIIMVNHYDIIDAVISFTFENVKFDDKKIGAVAGLLSQLQVDKSIKEVRKALRDELNVPYTVVEDLLENFNFTCSIPEARHKLQKLMIDSPHLAKTERAFVHLSKVMGTLKQFGVSTGEIVLNPLSNYDNHYYQHGLMFQGLFSVQGSKRVNRIITGGRFDSLIKSFSSEISMTKTSTPQLLHGNGGTPHGVGFTLTTSFLFEWTKNMISRKSSKSGQPYFGSRCDVIVTSTDQNNINKIGFELLGKLWSMNISADIITKARPQDELLLHAAEAGSKWIILIRGGDVYKKSKKPSGYKPLRVRNLATGKEVSWDTFEDVSRFILESIANEEKLMEDDSSAKPEAVLENTSDVVEEVDAVDLNQKFTVINNEAPRGRKNKRDRWEDESIAKSVGSKTVQSLAQGPVLIFDIRDEVLDMIGVTSIHQQDEWIRKIVFGANNLPKSFALNIHNALVKESAKGHRWCILVASRTQHTAIVDLQR